MIQTPRIWTCWTFPNVCKSGGKGFLFLLLWPILVLLEKERKKSSIAQGSGNKYVRWCKYNKGPSATVRPVLLAPFHLSSSVASLNRRYRSDMIYLQLCLVQSHWNQWKELGKIPACFCSLLACRQFLNVCSYMFQLLFT